MGDLGELFHVVSLDLYLDGAPASHGLAHAVTDGHLLLDDIGYLASENTKYGNRNAPEDIGPTLGDNTYTNRGDEMQSRAVDRTLINGIPKEGIEKNMEKELIQKGFNPYELRDPQFMDTMMSLRDISMFDGDYSNQMAIDLKYDKVPGTGGLARPDFNPTAEDGGMLDDEEYTRRLDEEIRVRGNLEWLLNDGPQLRNPHNPLGGIGR